MIGNKIGKAGEDIAVIFLERRGFAILERNYWKPYGEIDVICEKNSVIHFIEVKSVTSDLSSVSRERVRPEDNIHSHKLRRLGRVIQAFLSKKNFRERDWVFDVCVVRMDLVSKRASVRFIENQVIPE